MKVILHKSFFLFLIIVVFLFVGWTCPVQSLTGYPCPGCMMTTAAYYFIQGDLKSAFAFNPAIFVLLIGGIMMFAWRKNSKACQRVGIIVLILWILIYSYRMITIFPEWPMPYVENNFLQQILSCF